MTVKQFCKDLNFGMFRARCLGLLGAVFISGGLQLQAANEGGQLEEPALKYFFEDPSTIEQYVLLESIPHALNYGEERKAGQGIDAALEIFSADAVVDQERIGVVLGLKSAGEVYEHSKYITDRINGAEIEEIFSHSFRNIFPLLVTRFKTPEGAVELSCSFSAFLNKDQGFTLESHWNKEEYSSGETFYNFQLWAADIEKLEVVVGEVLTRLMLTADVTEVYTTRSPKVYIAKQAYENGRLLLDVVNQAGIAEVTLTGSRESEFLIEPTPMAMTVNLSGARQERVVIPASTELYVGGGLKFLAPTPDLDRHPNQDGSWGVFYDELAASVDHFDISESTAAATDRPTVHLKRKLSVQGMVRDEVVITRSIHPEARSSDYSNYNALTLKIGGVTDLEIILVKASIENFRRSTDRLPFHERAGQPTGTETDRFCAGRRQAGLE